jgi:hypothetical protein
VISLKKNLLLVSVLLSACAANPLVPGAEKVDVVTAFKEVKKCSYIADVSGSQGNRFSGTFTTNENLLVGARNAIKNAAYQHGANTVLIQQQQYSQHELSGGTANATLVGKAYRCGS